jgi:hypothetical protein
MAEERIRGRLVEIEIGDTPGVGWVAVGVIRQGPGAERGQRFEVRASSRPEAEGRLRAEIEASLA